MSKSEVTQDYTDFKPAQIFEAGKVAFDALGFEIFKTRPFAFLIQAKKTGEMGIINANLIADAFSKKFTVTVKSEEESQASVDSLANEIIVSIEDHLKS